MTTNLGGTDEFGMPTSDATDTAEQPAYDEFGMPTSDPNADVTWGTNEDTMAPGYDEFGMPTSSDTGSMDTGDYNTGTDVGSNMGADMGGE